ncbi:MAG TPA: SusC/RagA family TonB-linked outer membrane protein [Prolixibacteraceae bacterium]|nr:SusC/RagA family TonB-linked outer membrane protein [Prolixibacteraceae bacterium]HCU59557.1 SusC/RagA family TonB-linked outer membrane protein [Prolixibacteraceae bacterium]
MKKNSCVEGEAVLFRRWKIFLIMKLQIVFILGFLIQSHAIVSQAQTGRLNLHFENNSLKEVLQTLEDQTDFSFVYKDEQINRSNNISGDFKDKLVNEVLDDILKNSELTYTIKGRAIVILPGGLNGLSAQQKTVNGRVTDSSGQPLPGVSLVVKGTTKGTITDFDGKYTLANVPGDAVLVFSFVGMKMQEISVGNKTELNVTMEDETVGIEEVVAVGYGIMKKRDLTGSVSSINFTESMESRPLTNLSSGLAGMSAGLVVSQNSSAPGNESVSLHIRGVGTLNNSSPLVLIDGVAGNMNDVNPNDVANISVLKDASSCAIYGSRAANGVILITTKRGKVDNMSINYNGYVGVESAAKMIDFISDYPTHLELMNEAYQNSGQPKIYGQNLIDEWRANSKTDPTNYPNTDWFREILKPSVISEHNLSVRGGSEKSNFLLSLGYLDNKGVVENAEYEKYSFRLNADSKVSDWLSLGGNVFGFWSDRGPLDVSYLFNTMLMTNPGILPKSSDGRYGGSMMEGENTKAYNPRATMESATGNNERQRVGVKFFAKMNFLKYFEFETSFAGNFDNRRSWQYSGPVSIWDFRTDAKLYETSTRNSITNSDSRYYSTTLNELLRFNYSLNNVHHIGALIGFDQEYSRQDQFSASKYDMLNDAIYVLDAAAADPVTSGTAEDRALRSYFGRINYNYKGKYLFEANGRYDGSSRFSEDNRWGFFPSFAAGWRFSEEPFFKPLTTWIDNAKFRASWGKLGNNNIGDYEYQSLYAGQNYSFGGNIAQGIAPTVISNSLITWEETTSANLGLDLNMFNSKLSLSFDVFDKTTDNILVKLPIPLVMGNLSAPSQNAAQVRNRGWEAQLSYFGNIGKDFEYSIGGNISSIDNKVLKYMGDVKTISGTKVLTEGVSIFPFYVREVDHVVQDQAEIDAMIADGYTFSPAIPKPGDFLYKDLTDDKKINDDDRVIKGSSIPKATYGINIGASYKGVDLNIIGQGVSGLNYYDGGTFNSFNLHWDYIMRENVLNRWTPDNKTTAYPRLTAGLANNDVNSDYWLANVSYFRIKSIQLGYTIPKRISSKILINRFRLYTSLENYFTFTSYEGFDPENAGVTYPNMKQFIVGLNVTF